MEAVGANRELIDLTLAERISSGGEGSVFETNNDDLVAKIYKKNRQHDFDYLENKYRKCCWFVNKRISYDGICVPTYLLADDDENFIGYAMTKARGKTLSSVIHPIELSENYPQVNRLHLVKLCISLLEQISYLHDNGILAYDLDMANVIVDNIGTDKVKTYLIDCDSFQIGVGHATQYPGNVGRPLMVPPELQGIPYEQQHRTFTNEYFSIAVLLFEILVPNQDPYMMKGGQNDMSRLVKDGLFPYPQDPTDADSAESIPSQWARDIWGYLPDYITRLFWNNLHKDGAYHAPEDRTTPKEWLAALRSYAAELEASQGDLEIFPSQRKEEPVKVEATPAFDYEAIAYDDLDLLFDDEKKNRPAVPGLNLYERESTYRSLSFLVGAEDMWVVSTIITILALYLTFIFDPLGIIDKSHLPSFMSNTPEFIYVTIIPVCALVGALFKPAFDKYEHVRNEHYRQLMRRAETGDIFKDGELMKEFEPPCRSEMSFNIQEHAIAGLMGLAMAFVTTALVYGLFAWIS